MHGPWGEIGNVRLWAAVIETAAGMVLAGYSAAAFGTLLMRRSTDRARKIIADGALTALGFILCATLLKTLLLSSWQQIGIFASVLSLRTVMKRIFAAEAQLGASRRLDRSGR
jgi:uncharacterized membrane protein